MTHEELALLGWPIETIRSRPIPTKGYTYMYGLRDQIERGWRHAVAPIVELRVGRWTAFQFADPADLSCQPACYVVQIDGLVVYVGQTRDLRTRFKGHGFRLLWDEWGALWHRTPWGFYELGRVGFKRREVERYGDWLMHECRLIRRLRPSFNCYPP